MLKLLLIVPFFFLAACAATKGDVIKCGKGSYVVSGSPDHAFGNYLNTSRDVAFERANTFCRSKRKYVLVDNIREGLPTYVTFRCLKEGDPELAQSPWHPVVPNADPCK